MFYGKMANKTSTTFRLFQEAFLKFKTRITELFSIEYPIIQAGMVWVSTAPLAAAVSKAGGLGLIAGGSCSPNTLTGQINKLRAATENPFGVNIPLLYSQADELIDVCIDLKVPVVFTSAGNPRKYTSKLRNAGIKVVHVVPSARLAKKAVEAGCDAVVAEGAEGGGHLAFDEVASIVLTPAVVEAVDAPVISAGGISDGRSMAAALCLGAEGVQVGTRFIASAECEAHENYKRLILNSEETSTTVTCRKIGPIRQIKNPLSNQIYAMEAEGRSNEEILEFLGPGRSYLAGVEGNLEQGTFQAGQVVGLIHEIKPAGDIVREMAAQAASILSKLSHAVISEEFIQKEIYKG